ncbi:hypothetical protein Tco_0317432 [Tanacetum coccineum]
MEALKFVDSYNMVAYMEKSIENANFDEIVDFLNANPIRYALTVSPNIYVSYIEQFWSTAKIKIVNKERQIRAKVKGKTTVISESSVRKDLQFMMRMELLVFANMRRKGKDFSGTITPLFATMLIQPQAVEGEGSGQPTEPQHTPTTASPSNIEPIPIIASSSQPQKTHKHETVHEERGDSMERAATTAASLDAEQDSGNIIRTQSMATLNEPIPQGTGSVNTLGSGEDRLEIMELMEIYTKLSDRVLALENVKTSQDLEITSLNKRVKKLDKKKKARTPQLKRRLYKVRIESSADKSLEDAKTQGRYDHDIDVTSVSTPITTAGVSVSTTEPSTPLTTTILIEDKDLTIAQTLIKMRSEKSKEKSKDKSKEKGVSSETATTITRGVTMQEPKKGPDQVDEEMAKRLADELEAELEEEEKLAKQRKEKANLISWDNTQGMMEADYELAQRLQAEE